jgi:hypothetical protein
MKHICAALFCFFVVNCLAQKTFVVQQKQTITHAIPFEDLYMYPVFQQATVYYKGQPPGGGLVNYNYLLQELHFIGANNDTLPIADPELIDSVVTGNDRLYYYDGFVKLDTIVGAARLAMRNVFSLVDKKAVGFNGISTTSTPNLTYIQYKFNTSLNLVAEEQLLLSKDPALYIGDRMNNYLLVNKKNLNRFYSKKQSSLKKYAAEHAVDYNERNSIANLIIFMEQQ